MTHGDLDRRVATLAESRLVWHALGYRGQGWRPPVYVMPGDAAPHEAGDAHVPRKRYVASTRRAVVGEAWLGARVAHTADSFDAAAEGAENYAVASRAALAALAAFEAAFPSRLRRPRQHSRE